MAVGGFDGSIRIDTKIDTKNFNAGVGKIGNSLRGLAGAVGLAFGVTALVKFGKEALKVSSDLQEVQNVVDVTFGEGNKRIEQFAQTAIEALGMSELSAKEYVSTLGSMGKAMGFASGQNEDMSISLTSLIGDFASFKNISQKEAFTALSAVYTGETETLKRYGILITDVNLQEYARQQGIDKSIQKMTQQEKVMLRYNYIMGVTKDMQGDFVRTQDSWANQTRILSELWKSFLGTIGKGLIQVLTPAIKALNGILKSLISFAKSFSGVTGELFGKQEFDTGGQQQLTDSVNDSATAEKNLADSAKEAKKALLGFDEINTLDLGDKENKDTAVDLTGMNGALNGTPMELDADVVLNPKLQNVADTLKQLYFDVQTAWQPTKKALQGLWDSLSPVKEFVWTGLKDFYEHFLKPMMTWYFSEYLPRFFGAIENAVKNIDWENINNSLKNFWDRLAPFNQAIGEGLLWLWENVLVPFGTWIMNDVVPVFLDLLSGALSILTPIIEVAKDVLAWLWDNFLQPIAVWTGGVIISVLQGLADVLKTIGDWMSNHQSIVTAMTVAIAGFFGAWKVIELMSFIQQSGGAVGAFGKLTDAIKACTVEKLKDMIETAKLNLMYAKDFVVSVAQGTTALAKQAVQWVITTASKVADTIATWASQAATLAATAATWLFNTALMVLTSPITLVILAIGALIAIVILIIKHWDEIKEVAKKCWDAIVSAWKEAGAWFNEKVVQPVAKVFSGLWDGIKKAFTFAWDFITGAFKGYINTWIFIVENFVNFFIWAINGIIGGINKINFTVPDWVPLVGGRSVGFNIAEVPKVKIPRLATGAVIPPNAEFAAILGDQRNGRNLEAPEGLIRQIVREESGNNGGGDWIIQIVDSDRRIKSETVIKAIERKNRRDGKTVIPLGV